MSNNIPTPTKDEIDLTTTKPEDENTFSDDNMHKPLSTNPFSNIKDREDTVEGLIEETEILVDNECPYGFPINTSSLDEYKSNLSEGLTVKLPWTKKIFPEDEYLDEDHSPESKANGEKTSIEEGCCFKLCKEFADETLSIQDKTRQLSIEATELSKEADHLSHQAAEASRLCNLGMNKEVGFVSSMLSAISNIGNSVVSKISLEEGVAKTCELDYSPASKEANKLIDILETAKNLAGKTKEMTENAKCLDSLFTEEGKEHQTSLLQSLMKSREALESTAQTINDLECSASSSNLANSIKEGIQGMLNHLYFKEFIVFCCGLGLGGAWGYTAGYALKSFKERKSDDTN